MFLVSALSWILAATPQASISSGTVFLRAGAEGSGTGFVIDAEKRLVLTCRHVVGESQHVEVFFPKFNDNQRITERSWYLERREELKKNSHFTTGKVLRTSDFHDLALIELDKLPTNTKAITLSDSPPSLGSPIWSLGQRGDIETLWNLTTGTVRQAGTMAEGYPWESKTLAANSPGVVMQLPIERGDSGGPVWNEHGEIVAIVSAHRGNMPLVTLGPSTLAIRQFLKVDEPKVKPAPIALPEKIARSTVWISPQSTSTRTAGVFIDAERRWVLTSATGLGVLSRVGVTFSKIDNGTVVGERAEYQDPVNLHLNKLWRTGTVKRLDFQRDLALIELDSVPEGRVAISMADTKLAVGGDVHHISHPMGLDFAFVYAKGQIRNYGQTILTRDQPKVACQLLQLPAQAKSSGGPLVNGDGQLIGILSSKETPTQQVAYAVELSEVRKFLDEYRRSIVSQELQAIWNIGIDQRWCQQFTAGILGCSYSHTDRAKEAIPMLDSVIELSPQQKLALLYRAECWLTLKEPKKAIADLHRILDPNPGDVIARFKLAASYAAAGDDEKCANEYANVLRLDVKRLPAIAIELDRHATILAKDRTERANDWLLLVFTSIHKVLPDDGMKRLIGTVLEANRTPQTTLTQDQKYKIWQYTLQRLKP